MLKPGAWLALPLLSLPLAAQNVPVPPPVLPENVPLPEVDMISPVPAPEIAYGSPGAVAPEMPKNLKVDNIGGGTIQYDATAQTLRYGGAVKITGDNGMEIFADSAVVDQKAQTATLEGNVSVYQGNLLQRGDRAVYFYERKFLDASGLRASLDPILLESGKFTAEDRNGKMVFVGRDAGITTHDVEEPDFWVRAAKTTIYPGEKVVFNNLRLYAGDTPVFWLPYLSQPLDAELGYHFIPGGRSNWGVYLLNTYGIMLGGDTNPDTGENEDAWLLSKWHLDLRSKRGIGTGVDLVDIRQGNKEEIDGFSFYYLNDLAPDTERSGVPRGFVNEDRYTLELQHRLELDIKDGGKWRLDTNLNYLSDNYYLQDLDPSRYAYDPQPDNTIGLYRRDDRSLLSVLLRPRVNDFYRSDTRLPEIAFDQAKAPLFGLPILHEGSSSMSIIGERAGDLTKNSIIDPLLSLSAGDPEAQRLLDQLGDYERGLAEQIIALPPGDPRREALKAQLLDSSYARFHTYQEFSMPMMLGNFLSLVPEAGIGHTSYRAVDGPADSMDRTHLHAGAEASVKFSKNYGNYRNWPVGLDGLLHVIQPYANWSVIKTDDVESDYPSVDRLTATTRPRPLDPTRFTAIDDLQSWNIVRMGARNRLLTKRDGQTFEWLYLNTYIDAFIQDPEGKREFSNLYNEARWQPLPWMSLDVETQIPVVDRGSGFNEMKTRVRFLPTPDMEFSLGYRNLDNHPVFTDSDRIDLQTFFRVSESWGLGTRHVLELDDNTLEVQQYTVHRDLGNWVAGMGITHRDNRREEELGVIFSLTLKDFPSVSLPFKIDAQ